MPPGEGRLGSPHATRWHYREIKSGSHTWGVGALKWRYFVVGTRFCASAARPNAGNAVYCFPGSAH